MRKFAAAILVSVLLVSLLGCAVNPVTGKKELSLISEAEEINLGKQTDAEIGRQFGFYDDSALNQYVESVGKALVPHTHRPNLPYRFVVLDTPVVNAFAVPGGYIYLTRGILALINSEAEMAVVLGHELGHVNARHSVRRMSELMLVQLGLAVGSALNETFAKFSGLAGVGIQLLFLKYSRDDEYQADMLGVEYSRKGGYNPSDMIGFFAALEKLGDLSGGHTLPGFLSTHPLTKDRITKVRSMVQEGDQALARRDQPYLRKINGIIYGDDPRQGYVEGQAFYHPDLAFTFSVPDGWTVKNTPGELLLQPKDGKAALVLQAEKNTASLPEYARKKAEGLQNERFLGEDHLPVSGLASYHHLYRVEQQNGVPLRLRLSLIQKGPIAYAFFALSSEQDFGAYDSIFRRTVQSFSELRDPRFLNRQPQRLKLIEANGSLTLEEMFSRQGMKKDLLPSFAILNGLELKSVPSAGRLVKIVS